MITWGLCVKCYCVILNPAPRLGKILDQRSLYGFILPFILPVPFYTGSWTRMGGREEGGGNWVIHKTCCVASHFSHGLPQSTFWLFNCHFSSVFSWFFPPKFWWGRGGSSISRRRGRQPSRGRCHHTNIPKNCIKLRKYWYGGGRGTCTGGAPWIRHCEGFEKKLSHKHTERQRQRQFEVLTLGLTLGNGPGTDFQAS